VAFAQYAHLLKQIKPESLPTILSNKLDGTMLTTILTTIVDYIVAEGWAHCHLCLFVRSKWDLQLQVM
jgi:hypothetical protein